QLPWIMHCSLNEDRKALAHTETEIRKRANCLGIYVTGLYVGNQSRKATTKRYLVQSRNSSGMINDKARLFLIVLGQHSGEMRHGILPPMSHIARRRAAYLDSLFRFLSDGRKMTRRQELLTEPVEKPFGDDSFENPVEAVRALREAKKSNPG